MSKTYIGDTNTEIILWTGQNISAATELEILVRKPSGAEVSWPATLYGTESLRFATQADTLDEDGVYFLQARVTTANGSWLGETTRLRVYDEFR